MLLIITNFMLKIIKRKHKLDKKSQRSLLYSFLTKIVLILKSLLNYINSFISTHQSEPCLLWMMARDHYRIVKPAFRKKSHATSMIIAQQSFELYVK